MQNPFTGVWLHCCGVAEKKVPYVDGRLTPAQFKSLVRKHAPLPESHLGELVFRVINPKDVPLDCTFPEIVSKLKNIWYKYNQEENVLLVGNPFNRKCYSFIDGELV